VFGYVIEGLTGQVRALHWAQPVSPWHWLLGDDPLRHGLSWHSWLLPLAATAVLIITGVTRFARRDLR
jgi:ABC-2 type transport system permease protein